MLFLTGSKGGVQRPFLKEGCTTPGLWETRGIRWNFEVYNTVHRIRFMANYELPAKTGILAA